MASRSLGAFTLQHHHHFFFLFSLLLLAFTSLAAATSTPTKCYVLDGTHSPSAGFRCNNSTTGHSSCCGIGSICYSNGVCQQMNEGIQDFLRVGCTDRTWKDPACLDQCTSYAPDSVAGIRFCGGSIESTNQYCCDNGTNGIGSFACCQTPSDIFAINPIATSVAQIPLSPTSTPTSSPTKSSPSPSSSSSATPRPPATHTALALGLGLGIGIPLLLIAIITTLFFTLFRRPREAAPANPAVQTSEPGRYFPPIDPEPREVPGSMLHPYKIIYAGREYGELHDQARAHELPSDGS